MSSEYTRVSTNENEDEDDERKRQNSELAEKISNAIHALFWVVSGVGVAYYTDFLKVAFEDERVNR